MKGLGTGQTRAGRTWRGVGLTVLGVVLGWVASRVNPPVIAVPAREARGVSPSEAALGKVLPRVAFKQAKAEDAMRFFGEATGANVFVQWRDLEAAGIDKDAPVTVDLKDVSAKDALGAILRDLGGGNILLRYRCEGTIVRISTAEALARDAVFRTYGVADLVLQGGRPRLEQAPTFGLSIPNASDPFVPPPPRRELLPAPGRETAEQLIRVIEETVDPTTWRDAGGWPGTIGYFGGVLAVVQTPEAHEKIASLLEQLRREGKR